MTKKRLKANTSPSSMNVSQERGIFMLHSLSIVRIFHAAITASRLDINNVSSPPPYYARNWIVMKCVIEEKTY